MATNITGVRDDSEWPRIGGVIDLPDGEAEDLIRNGYARPVADDFVPAAVDAQGQPVVDDDGKHVPVSPTGDRLDPQRAQDPPRVEQGTDTRRPLPPKAENVVDPDDEDKAEVDKSHADRADDDYPFSGPNEAATVDPDVPEGPKSKLRRGGR
jgi:hypothetical protein